MNLNTDFANHYKDFLYAYNEQGELKKGFALENGECKAHFKDRWLAKFTHWTKSVLDFRFEQKKIDRIIQRQLPVSSFVPPNGYSDSCWMKFLPDHLKAKKINAIFLPGSHDAGAYRFDYKKKLSEKGLSSYVAAVRALFLQKVITGWSKTQQESIYQQLQNGVRYFDLRIDYHVKDEKFYLSHTFACGPLEETLDEIARFVKENPSEVIILNCRDNSSVHNAPKKEKPEQTEDKSGALAKLLQEKLGNHLHKNSSHNQFYATVQEMVDSQQTVMAYYNYKPDSPSEESSEQATNFWPRANVYSPWHQTDDIVEKKEKLEQEYNSLDIDKSCQLYCQQMVLTPKDKDIVLSTIFRKLKPKPHNIEEVDQSIRHYLPQFYHVHKDTYGQKVNIALVDFVSQSCLMDLVREINQLSSQRSSNSQP